MRNHDFIKSAKKYCLDNQLRLTPPRQYVLEILAQSKTPLGAYDVLDQLGQNIDNPKPPTAYRAIDFWRQHGFVHKIESLNVFIMCCEDHAHSDTHFLVCDDCQSVQELHRHNDGARALPTGFVAKRSFTETHGTCIKCVQES
jgi:Fur family zinc uptake transcriptional regulator